MGLEIVQKNEAAEKVPVYNSELYKTVNGIVDEMISKKPSDRQEIVKRVTGVLTNHIFENKDMLPKDFGALTNIEIKKLSKLLAKKLMYPEQYRTPPTAEEVEVAKNIRTEAKSKSIMAYMVPDSSIESRLAEEIEATFGKNRNALLASINKDKLREESEIAQASMEIKSRAGNAKAPGVSEASSVTPNESVSPSIPPRMFGNGQTPSF